MIDIKYRKMYDEFIEKYEEMHVCPWHQITKEELNNIYNNLVNSMDVVDEYTFKYFMDYIIKRLSGLEDAHTKYKCREYIPFNFRKFNNEILINYPENLKGSSLVSINGIPINNVINELEEVITYGTKGKRNYEIENSLINKMTMFGLPTFRGLDELTYEIEGLNGNHITKKIRKIEEYNNLFDIDKYLYGNTGEYKVIDNCLIYNHTSVQMCYKNQIEESINRLKQEDLSDIDTIIIDIRGNTGGNSRLNEILIDYLKTQPNKKLICLTDYRVFSSGTFALRDLIEIGATTIGEEIATPINHFGNNVWVEPERVFSISTRYFHPFYRVGAWSKETFNENIKPLIRAPYIFHPDIEINETKEDFINNEDRILNYALNYSKEYNIGNIRHWR